MSTEFTYSSDSNTIYLWNCRGNSATLWRQNNQITVVITLWVLWASPSSWIPVTNCHDSPLILSVSLLWSFHKYTIIYQNFWKQTSTSRVSIAFPEATGRATLMMLASTQEATT
jgi:hypothetical protein